MAMSFSRPDPSSPTSIADASFGTSRRGFDQAEVRDFLRMVAAEFGRLRERERFLDGELQAAQANAGTPAPVDDETLIKRLGEESVRILTTARDSAAEIRGKAEQAAAQLLHEASDEALRVREEADIEASRRRSDAAADAESELSMAKQQGREMVNEARAYRERVLSELARRRELAREQIEQLIHGRDRLTQAFERARLVAVDVVAEMQPLGEPDEYVNLTPTTGPLPVMIANSPRPAETGAVEGRPSAVPALTAVADDESSDDSSEVVDDEADADHVADIADVSDSTEAEDVDAPAEIDESVEAVEAVDVDEAVEADESVEADEAVEAVDADEVEDAAAVERELFAMVETDAGRVDDETESSIFVDDVDLADDSADHTAGDDDDSDDVVVDLFARLRADADHDVSAETELDNEVWSAEVLASIEKPAATTAIIDLDADTDVADTDVADTDVDVAEGDVSDSGESTDEADPEATPFEQRDELITPLIVSSAKKLKRALADEQNDVLDSLRRSDAVRNLDALLPWASEHSTRYTEAIADDVLAAVHGGSATSRIGNRKIRKALATEAVDVANDALMQWLVMPLRDQLERCISAGEGDNTVVTKKVRAIYREFKTQRIDETLDDVMRCAHGRGVLAGFDLDTPIVWEVDQRFPACPDCEDNALAGAVAAGAQFPTGDSFAPAHQGCRCLLVAADR